MDNDFIVGQLLPGDRAPYWFPDERGTMDVPW